MRRLPGTAPVAGLLAAICCTLACGKYGPPIRSSGAPASQQERETNRDDDQHEPQELP